ncbi:protein FAR1-RELATED SEQUENCE 1 [Euphorbia lathyris]|uniref:protein FAR1-RELATED SEQUENCE 1 n=1 Tax=Euphorbia lathyris TaxID=212925 RepID=UPI0033144D95
MLHQLSSATSILILLCIASSRSISTILLTPSQLLVGKFLHRDIMTSTTNEQDFLDSDGACNDETYEGLEITKDELLSNCILQNISTNGVTLAEPSIEEDLGASNLEPYTGMTFPSLEDARDFYYEYAKREGFTIRTNRIRHSLKNMAVIGRDFVCSREGFRAAKHALRKDRVLPSRPVTREGCKAMIRLAARDGGKWAVTKFVQEHNHKLMSHHKFPGELPTINILSEEEKDKKIQDLYDELQRERERSAAVQHQLCMILKDVEEHAEFMSLRVEDIINNLRQIEIGNI